MAYKNIDSSSAARFESFRRLEEQFCALQLQPLQVNQVSQQGTNINAQVQEVRAFGSNNIVHNNLQQQNPSNHHYGLINNYPINHARGGLSTGHGHGGYVLPPYRICQRGFIEAAATALRMHRCNACNDMNNFPPLPSTGWLVSMAMNRSDCRYLQKKIEEGNPIDVELILYGVKDSLHMLMTHPFGNHLIKKIFEARSSITNEQMNSLVYLIISNYGELRNVCMDDHGTRVTQIMVKNMRCPYTKYVVTYIMKHMTLDLMKNLNGSYVIMQCLIFFPPELQSVILNEVVRNCVRISTHKIGTTAIQKCLTYGAVIATAPLLTKIISNSMILAENEYGNYVLECVIKMRFPDAKEQMIKELHGKFVRLSKNKYASNVVEHLLKFSDKNDVEVIVEEIMRSHEFLNVLQDPYGNYVAQTALECTQGLLRRKLSNLIISNHKALHSHLHGKNVLTMANAIYGRK